MIQYDAINYSCQKQKKYSIWSDFNEIGHQKLRL
jgi:hypothetical protein